MNDTETIAIVASTRQIPVYSINAPIEIAKDDALARSGLIGKVTGHDSKVLAVRAQQEIKGIINTVEKLRVREKEPLLNAGRQLDALCATFKLDLEKEFGRLSEVVRLFDDDERKRVREEQRLQELELQRIQREKDAEIERLRKEQEAKEAEARRIQEEADRKVREAQQAAAALEAAAKNEKQRQLAQEARLEAERAKTAADAEKAAQAQATAQQQAELEQRTAQIEETASEKAYVAAKPVEITRVAGQMTRPVHEIKSINIWVLSKARPDLVTNIEFDKRAINAELARGVKLPGVESQEIYKAGVRGAKMSDVIEA